MAGVIKMYPKILYVSCAENGFYGLQHFINHGFEISAVITISPKLGESLSVSGYYDFAPFCHLASVEVIVLNDYNLTPDDIRGIDFDLIVVNGWNRLIAEDVIAMSPLGALGVHAGHPPIGLGRAPLVWNILLGHTDIEVYIFKLTPYADDGRILAMRIVEITSFDNVRHLYEKVMFVTAYLFIDAIKALCEGFDGVEQDIKYTQHYKKRVPEDGLIDFNKSELEIHNFVRAQVPPYPGAFAYLSGVRWTIYDAHPFDRFAFRAPGRRPGTILCCLPSGIVVQTGGAPVWIMDARADDNHVNIAIGRSCDSLIGLQFNP